PARGREPRPGLLQLLPRPRGLRVLVEQDGHRGPGLRGQPVRGGVEGGAPGDPGPPGPRQGLTAPAREGRGPVPRAAPLPTGYPRMDTTWLSRLASCDVPPAPFRRLAIAQSRFPSRFPGPLTAVMSSTTRSRCTVSPSRLRSSGPRFRFRIAQPGAAA